ncbi:hypothetical protein ABTZ57_16055 [Streptomyces sp. NPDC094048]|uniref:hypothetical protein n=1 Tax=Streptomyces sp. NPDC094048 TaxID=3155207 RepID=UPI0033302B2A
MSATNQPTAGPTVAELRAEIEAQLSHADSPMQAGMLRSIVEFLDDYTHELTSAAYAHVSRTSDTPAPKQQAADARAWAAARQRLAAAAAARRAWKEFEPQLPQIIADAAWAGRKPRDIARDIDATESYVYRVIRETAAQVPARNTDQ